MHKTITLLRKAVPLFFFLLLAGISSKAYAQCAGEDASTTSCDKETNQFIDLFAILGGSPVAGGTWTDDNNSGGLNASTGVLDTWLINRGGTFNYTYTVNGVSGCTDNSATVTVTLAGYPGRDNDDGVACETETNVNLFQFVGSSPSPTLFGTWVITNGPNAALNGQIFNAQQAGPGIYTFTYTVDAQGSCPSAMSTVMLEVIESPESGTVDNSVNTTFCETDDLSGFTTFNLRDAITGEDNGGVWTENQTNEINGFNDSTIDIQNIRDSFGPGTYTFTYTVQPVNPLCSLSQTTVAIVIEEVVDFTNATLELTTPADEDDIICEDTLPINAVATITGDVTDIPNGDYELTYSVSPAPNTGTETVTLTMTEGVGSFNINPDFFTASGVAEIRVVSILDPNTQGACEVKLDDLSDTLTIVALPDLSDSVLSVDQPLCFGENSILTISDSGTTAQVELVDGEYNFSYTLSSSTASADYTQTETVTNGVATLTLASNALATADDYTVTLNTITNSTDCATNTAISITFTVSPKPDAETVTVSIQDSCEDDTVTVAIVDSADTPNLADGTYDFTYDISGAINATGQTASGVTITSGTGSFDLPQDILANGSSTLTLTSVLNNLSTCEAENLTNPTATFSIIATPDFTGATITSSDICEDENATFTIQADPTTVVDGDYSVTYTISGENTSEENTLIVTFTDGEGNIILLADGFTATGATTFTITSVTISDQNCPSVGLPLSVSLQINERPVVDDATLSAASVCENDDAIISITDLDIEDGNYEISYSISGANSADAITEVINVVSGQASFSIPAASIANTGSTTVSISLITDLNVATACSTEVTELSTTFDVNPNPDFSNVSIALAAETCQFTDAELVITDETGTLADGTYSVSYTLTGENTQATQTQDVVITSGTGNLTLSASEIPNSGQTTISLDQFVNTTTSCISTNAPVATTFTIIANPDATNLVISVSDTCEDNPNEVTLSTDATLIEDGTYTLTYTLSGANTADETAVTVSFTDGEATFVIAETSLTEVGTTTFTITSLATDTQSCPASGLPISEDFEVTTVPSLENTTIEVDSVCLGENSQVTFSDSDLADGLYQFEYELTGSNSDTQTVNILFTGGSAVLPLDTAVLTASGTTTFRVNSVTNTNTLCVYTVAQEINFEIYPLPELVAGDLAASDVCLAENGFVSITAGANLADGAYTITYDLSGANTALNLTADVTIANGAGSFEIPAASLSATGTTTITATLINSDTGCTTVPVAVTDDFEVLPLPNAAGITGMASDVCFGEDVIVNLSGATSLSDADYLISYQLSGATDSEIITETTTFTGGSTAITLDSTVFTAGGLTTFSVLDIQNSTTGCSATNLTVTLVDFTLEDPAVPTIAGDGAVFCINDDPTIADLEANVSSSFEIITYDAASGGSVISPSTSLQANTTYYIAAQNTATGCEGSQRLAVTVDLTGCDSVFIPDGFSPNGDGINDVFEMKNMNLIYPDYTIEIFNRYGQIVFKGDSSTGFWNGHANQNRAGGNTLPNGVYFYIINYNDGQTSPKQGKVYLNR